MGKGEVHTDIWRGNLRTEDHLEDLGVGTRIILKWGDFMFPNTII
jgi:hypothetical protein